MSEPGFSLKNVNIAIVGLGLMGGSLALSLKGRCRRLSALDSDRATLELARRQAIVHIADSDPAKTLGEADLVILACPIPAIVGWLRRLPDIIQHSCIVLDIGSTKRVIVSALETLPTNFDPLGGHPICGRERLSLVNAERFLYRDAPFVLTPLSRTSERARSAALQIIEVLGAKPIWLNADDHDRFLASTSHLPYLISTALVHATPDDAASLVGSGFRSTSRLAETPSSMMMGILQTNRENILASLHRFQSELRAIESILAAGDFTSLETELNNARAKYRELITGS